MQRALTITRVISCRMSTITFVNKHNTKLVNLADWLIEHGFTSAPTQYRLYGRVGVRGEKLILQIMHLTLPWCCNSPILIQLVKKSGNHLVNFPWHRPELMTIRDMYTPWSRRFQQHGAVVTEKVMSARGWVSKAPAAHRTHVRLLTGVGPHVWLQAVQLWERSLTHTTLPRSLLQVNGLVVSNKLLACLERPRALPTDVVPLIRVLVPYVEVQRLRSLADFVADRTDILLPFPAVHHWHMVLEICRLFERAAARGTQEWTQVRVRPLVQVARPGLAEPLCAARGPTGVGPFTGVCHHVGNETLPEPKLTSACGADVGILLSCSAWSFVVHVFALDPRKLLRW